LDKAAKAVPKAETALAKAEDGVASALAAVATATDAVEAVLVRLEELKARQPSRPPAIVTARTPAPNLDEVQDYLPESYAHRQHQHPHESPWTMTLPLVILSFFAMVAGALNLPFTKDLHFLEHWLEPSLFGHEAELTASAATKWVLALVAVTVAVVAIVAAFRVYLRGRGRPATIEREVLAHAWYVDESYAGFFGGPGRKLFDLAAWFDRTVVDGLVRGTAGGLVELGRGLRSFQPGFVRVYSLSIGVGAFLVMGWFLLGRLVFL
jgi:NADH-quinone oxidoreductase subunit L